MFETIFVFSNGPNHVPILLGSTLSRAILLFDLEKPLCRNDIALHGRVF